MNATSDLVHELLIPEQILEQFSIGAIWMRAIGMSVVKRVRVKTQEVVQSRLQDVTDSENRHSMKYDSIVLIFMRKGILVILQLFEILLPTSDL